MSDTFSRDGSADDKHGSARKVAEAAMRAEAAGDTDRADTLMDDAQKIDPAAVVDILEERPLDAIPGTDTDDELAAMSETVVPNSDAPSRAGITGTGSGADNQGL